MKRLFIILAFFIGCVVQSYGYDFVVDGIYYEIISEANSQVSVTHSSNTPDRPIASYSGDITVPSSVIYNNKSYTVVAISDYAFSSCNQMTSISLPNSIKTIGVQAFGLTKLTSIIIPNSVTSIGESIFTNCEELKIVKLPDQLKEISKSAFLRCINLSDITIPETVTNIGFYAFYECTALKSIEIPSSVTIINESAFSFSGITSITIPSSITYIKGSAFNRCGSLQTIYSYITKPFNMYNDVFENISPSAELHIPKGTKSLYQQYSAWTQHFANIIDDLNSESYDNNYTLSISASGNGSAFYGGSSIRSTTRSFTVNEGTSVTISFSPDDGYQIKSVSVNGSTVSAGSSYTVTVNSNITIAVEFEAKPVDPIPVSTDYTLTISATGNGYASFGIHKITNQTASFTVTAGRVAIIDFVPGDGCRIKSVTANGSSIEVDSHNSVWLTINSNTVVSVVFEKIPVVTYTLTISAIGNGIASYNGTSVRNDSRDFSVSEGSNPNVSFTPDDFNLVKTVKLNGSEVSLSDNSYTISNVSSDNKIEVEFEEIDAKFTTEGVNYQVSSYESRTVVIGEGEYGLSLEVPEKVVSQGYEWTISGISDEAMSANKELAAIIWNPSTTINFRNVNPNLLLYVKDARYAPYGVNNVVINNEAESILLTESPSGNNFYCPIAFTAKKITYSHRYRMRTGGGDSRGWETIALPFDVQRIEHVEEGEILPFAKWSSTSTEKPFWLYQLGASGFIEAEGIKANTPYVISMPNNDVYQDNYKLRGTVTFSSTNVEVKKSDDIVKTTYGNRTLIPNFINLDNNVGNYALNVNNDMESYQGQENEGSVFIQNLRRIHPFEAYMTSTSGTRAIGVFDGMTTAIKGIEDIEKGLHILKVYNLNGQCIKTGTSMESLKHELPAGLYIINNKKIIIK